MATQIPEKKKVWNQPGVHGRVVECFFDASGLPPAERRLKSLRYAVCRLVAAVTALLLAASGARAYDLKLGTNLPPVSFHGFLSQGFLQSDQYNYLGDSTRGSFLFTEAGLNASVNPFPRTRITAQAFTFDMGQDVGKYDVVLDYALAEYTFNDYLGVRGGRIRRPEGIYNDVVDLDLTRTFVLLPQGIDDARWRDFYVAMDGGSLFGTIPLGKGGDLAYELYGGMVQPRSDGGLAKFYRNLYDNVLPFLGLHFKSFESNPQIGGQLWWHTPLDGMRLGVFGGYNFDYVVNLTMDTAGGPVPTTSKYNIPVVQGSVEYRRKNWTFQSEYFCYWLTPSPHVDRTMPVDSWYLSAAYRFNRWVEAGAYYTEYYGDTSYRTDPTQYQKDAALALRFDPTSWWIFKVEGHCIHGTGLLDENSTNHHQDDRLWFMLALKTTFSF